MLWGLVLFLNDIRYYQLGLALGFHCKHDEAIENYKNAINVIEAKQGIH